MTVAVNVDSVTTEDAAPTVAPNKISQQAGEDLATVKWTPTTTPSNATPIRAWRITLGGNRLTGRRMASLGCVCGIDRCGAPGVKPLQMTAGVQQTTVLTYAETGAPADGDYTINVNAHNSIVWDT